MCRGAAAWCCVVLLLMCFGVATVGLAASDDGGDGEAEAGAVGEGVAAGLLNMGDEKAFAAACARLGEAGVWDDEVAAAVVRLLGAKRYNRSIARGAMREMLSGEPSETVLRERWLELRGRKQRVARSVLVELGLDAARGGESGAAGVLEVLRGEGRIAVELDGLGDWVSDGGVRLLVESLPIERVKGDVKAGVLAVFDDALTRLHGRYGEEDILNGLSNDGVVVACVEKLVDGDLRGRLREALSYAVHRRGYSMGYGAEMAELVVRLERLAGR